MLRRKASKTRKDSVERLCQMLATILVLTFVFSSWQLAGAGPSGGKPIVPASSAWWGAAVSPFKSNSSQHESAIRARETQLGRTFGISVHYFYWGAPGYAGSPALTASNLQKDVSFQGDIRHHRTPLISWRCGDNMTRIASGADDASVIIPAALALKAEGIPVFLRWFYEWNLDRNGKGEDRDYSQCFTQPNQGTAAQQAEFIAAWEHIWRVFHDRGADNVSWVWCIAGAPSNITSDLVGFLPPRPYVDWTAEDGYDKKGIGFVATFASAYDAIGKLDGLPNMIAESGETNENVVAPWSQARWFVDASASIGPGKRFANIKAFAYSDQPAGVPGKDWTLTGDGLAAFKEMGADPFYAVSR